MALVRWQPFREIESLQNEMNRLFESVLPTAKFNYEMGTTFAPAAEIQETPEAVILKLEVPGLEAKDLDVEVTAEAVSIKGERREETKTEEKGVTRSEFRYG
ncbi:MAG: Hsp20/alpha crystallin family protein, partial [Okeania sp. SIO2H7]|nr:Hsp20/alpha crystallin family protein [Okeania sp. SIO2H7]